ncbi:MAG: hypothetical protein KUG79_18730 [Pseudomonadales bacterium]|nr:hypothetical protein [Pseudomonadales bacterium]
MSNHYHIVLNVNPGETVSWPDAEVIAKWFQLNPRKNETPVSLTARKTALLADPDRVTLLRNRLGSLSWFMKYINEPLARLANQEDGCKGRFWEGRFKSQGLLDEAAILAAMVYVDLNPLRADITDNILATEYTSINHRLKNDGDKNAKLCVINKPNRHLPFSYSLTDYIALVQWTAIAQQSKRPTNIRGLPPDDLWFHHYLPKPNQWQRVLGSVDAIKSYARDIGQCWIRTRSA